MKASSSQTRCQPLEGESCHFTVEKEKEKEKVEMLCVSGPLPARPMDGETVMPARMAPVHGCVTYRPSPCSLLLPYTIKTAPLLFNSPPPPPPPPPQLISFVVPVSPSSQFDIYLMTSSTPHFKGDRTVHGEPGNKFTVKPRALDIVWGGDSRYWRIESGSDKPAELLQVSWLEVSGSIELGKLKAGQMYALTFTVSMKPDAFGWGDSPVYLMAKPGDKYNWKKADLSSLRAGDVVQVPKDNALRFSVPDSIAAGEKLQFGMYEIWKGRWKGGLVIHEVVIEPVASA